MFHQAGSRAEKELQDSLQGLDLMWYHVPPGGDVFGAGES